MTALRRVTGMDHRLITPYNPRANGRVERMVGLAKQVLKKMIYGDLWSWNLFVPFLMRVINSRISSLTGSSPLSLMFNRTPRELRDYTAGDPAPPVSLDRWKEYQDKVLSVIYPAIYLKIKGVRQKQIDHWKKTRRIVSPTALPPGSLVTIKDLLRSDKMAPRYVGRYMVVQQTQSGNYVLRQEDGKLLDRHVPIDQIKVINRGDSDTSASSDDVYEVEAILDHRGDPGNYEFLVQWKGPWKPTWEPQRHILDDQLLRHYWYRVTQTHSSRV
jgi:hypothetical protein